MKTNDVDIVVYKNCYNCCGTGYNNRTHSRYQWNSFSKQNQLKFYTERQVCYICKRTGKVRDIAEQEKIKKKRLFQQLEKERIEKEKQQHQEQMNNKVKKYKEFMNKQEQEEPFVQQEGSWIEKSFLSSRSSIKEQAQVYCGWCAGKGYEAEYMKQNIRKACTNCYGSGKVTLNSGKFPQPSGQKKEFKVQKVQKKQNKQKRQIPKKQKHSDSFLKAQFQKEYQQEKAKKQQQKRRQQYQKYEETRRKRQKQQQVRKKQAAQRDKNHKQFLLTPQGQQFQKNKQKERKKQQFQKNCFRIAQKICKVLCCGRNRDKGYLWAGALVVVGFFIFVFMMMP